MISKQTSNRCKTGSARSTIPAIILFILIALPGATTVRAERYLTVAQAQNLCFPEADRFEEQTVRFTREQAAAVETKSGVKVRNRGNRLRIAWRGTNLLGVLVVDHVLGKHEIIDYAVAISPGGKVLQIELLEYRESHGYEIRGARWRDQFKGRTADSRLKLNDDIFNISGATISCRHVTEGIKRVLATHDLVVRPRLSAVHKLPDASPSSEP